MLCFPTTEAGGTVGTSCPGHATGLVHVHRNASEEGAGGSALRSLLKTRSHRPAREEEPVALPVAQPSLKLPAAGEPSPGRATFQEEQLSRLTGSGPHLQTQEGELLPGEPWWSERASQMTRGPQPHLPAGQERLSCLERGGHWPLAGAALPGARLPGASGPPPSAPGVVSRTCH